MNGSLPGTGSATHQPLHSGHKRPADDTGDHYDGASFRAPPSDSPGYPPPHHRLHLQQHPPHAADHSRQPSSNQEDSVYGDAGGRDDDGEGGLGGGAKRVKTNAPPLKRGSACTLCRKRKLRCDGVRPACGTCLRLSHECVYGDPTQERIAERHRELEDRIRALEAELETHRRGGAPTATAAGGPPFSPFSPGDPRHSDDSAAYSALQATHGLDSSAADGAFPQHAAQQPQPHHPFAEAPAAEYPQYPTQQLPVESPYIFQTDGALPVHLSPRGNGDPTFGQNSLVHGPRGSGYAHRDSEAFPLPPRLHDAYISSAQPAANGSPNHPVPVQAHLQSFPFAMNPTPQLSDLINPPSATALPQYSPGTVPSPGKQGGAPLSSAGYGEATIAPAWGTELPALELMLELAELYFATLHAHLPFLHRRRFLYTLHHPASLSSPPSQSLIFAVLAISAAYHDSPIVRAQGSIWYSLARQKVDAAINAGTHSHHSPAGAAAGGGTGRTATFTVEMVQALCLLSLIEMGVSDHQRAFLSTGQAVRIAAMLGLHRMDEDRVADRTGVMREKRLRPPALHPLPTDPVLLEECRRTMCTVIVLDRFESATVGWPAAIAEADVRVLLPCADELFEQGTCDATGRDNPLWWPADALGTNAEIGWEGIMAEVKAENAAANGGGGGGGGGGGSDSGGGADPHETESIPRNGATHLPRVGTFAWLCRVVWLGGRIQSETYRASGPPAGGAWNKHVDLDPLASPSDSLEMDSVIEYIRNEFVGRAARKAQQGKGVDGPMLMILLFLNCMFCNLFHLRASSGLSRIPFDPHSTIYVGSSEYAMKRCWDAIHSMHEILSQLAAYENLHTSLHRSRATTYTAFVPYVLYAIAFPAKFAIGDWTLLVAARDRSESVMAHLARDDLPSGDDAFPPSYLEERIAFVNIACDAMERVGTVWPVGKKFAGMIRGDCSRLVARSYARSEAQAPQQAPAPPPPPPAPSQSAPTSTVSPGRASRSAVPVSLYGGSSNGVGRGNGSPTLPPTQQQQQQQRRARYAAPAST